MADTLVYVYAIGDAAFADEVNALAAVEGVDHAPVRLVVSGPLAAIVSSVDPSQFSEHALRRHLEDLRWLEETARAHHHVVDAAFRIRPVAPLGLATVYLNDENVSALLGRGVGRFSSAIARVRGRIEWGVKAFTAGEPGAEGSEPPKEGTAHGPGATYLLRKRATRDRAERHRRRIVDTVEDAHRSLAALAVACRRYPTQDPRLTGHQDEMVMNVAYLVDEVAARDFRSGVEGWTSPTIRLELTGPWVPYSFASPEET